MLYLVSMKRNRLMSWVAIDCEMVRKKIGMSLHSYWTSILVMAVVAKSHIGGGDLISRIVAVLQIVFTIQYV